jgi:hypothetical protein
MADFPLWIIPIFLLAHLCIQIRMHKRIGSPAIYTLATHTFILVGLYLWLTINDYSSIIDTWALGLGFCSLLFWNTILMYLTRKRHIL